MPRRTLARPAVLGPVAVVVAAAIAVPAVVAMSGGSIQLDGAPDGALIGQPKLAALQWRVVPQGVQGNTMSAKLDGKTISILAHGSTYVIHPTGLANGQHTLTVTGDGGVLGVTSTSRSFTVDTTPPALSLRVPDKRVGIKDAVSVTGTVADGATVAAPGGKLTMNGAQFSVRYAQPPVGAKIVATDSAGNETIKLVSVPTTYPTDVRGVHVTGAAWAYPPLRDPVIQLIKEHRINAIELDVKDEDGIVNFDPGVALATQDGAVQKYYDPKQVADQMHQMGVRVIGRVVSFKDPKLGAWANAHGKKDWLVQTPSGGPYGGNYGSGAQFTNPVNKDVQDYNIAIAAAAAKAGFDDIVYDYVRRPDGPLSTMVIPGAPNNDATQAVVAYLQRSQQVLRPLGAYLGAAIFAQAVTRPQDTDQNVPMMAKYLDAVMPMDYPSHWNNGEYGVADPYTGMYTLVYRSLKDWAKGVAGTNCVVIPWLQDEDYKGAYTADKVQEEIKGARDNNMPGWLMWSAGSTYTADAFSPDAASTLR